MLTLFGIIGLLIACSAMLGAGIQATNYTKNTHPAWMGRGLGADTLVVGGFRLDATAFAIPGATNVTVAAGGVAAGAVILPITVALTAKIPAGSIIRFANVYLRLDKDAAVGTTNISIFPAPGPVAAAAVGTYDGVGRKVIPAGTVVGRTYAERDAGTIFGPADAADNEVYIVAFDCHPYFGDQLLPEADFEAYKPGNEVKENFLPGFAALAAGVKTLVRDRYICTIGRE